MPKAIKSSAKFSKKTLLMIALPLVAVGVYLALTTFASGDNKPQGFSGIHYYQADTDGGDGSAVLLKWKFPKGKAKTIDGFRVYKYNASSKKYASTGTIDYGDVDYATSDFRMYEFIDEKTVKGNKYSYYVCSYGNDGKNKGCTDVITVEVPKGACVPTPELGCRSTRGNTIIKYAKTHFSSSISSLAK